MHPGTEEGTKPERGGLRKPGQGKLTKEEREARQAERKARRMAQIQKIVDKRFAEKDTNGDGLLTAAEAPRLFERQGKADTNGDGALSKAELQAAMAKARDNRGRNRADRFAMLDVDKNGVVTKAEWKGPAEMFDRLDKDGNGEISKSEAAEMRRQRGDRGERGGRGDRRERMRERMKELDLNGNGSVERNEFPGDDEAFDRLDQNGDGVINKDDRRMRRGGGEEGGEGEGPKRRRGQRKYF